MLSLGGCFCAMLELYRGQDSIIRPYEKMNRCLRLSQTRQILAEVSDSFTGVSSLVSCVYWDAEMQRGFWETQRFADVPGTKKLDAPVLTLDVTV